MSGDEGFLSRWSRRKIQVKAGVPLAPEPTPPQSVPAQIAEPPATTPPQALRPAPAADPPPAEAPALPTLADVARLTRESDYSGFVRPGVDPAVRNAAMKKLFADPHYNIMDGLDVYIDDYGKPDPLPASMLRQMVQAKALGLFDDEEEAEQKPASPEATPDGADAPAAPPLIASTDENADLQLQPDDAARREGAGGGAEPV